MNARKCSAWTRWVRQGNATPRRLKNAHDAKAGSAAPEAGGQDIGAPGLRPQYHANDHAAFVIGPDGHDIEAVCHRPEA